YDETLANADAVIGVGTRTPLEPDTLAAKVLETHGGARVQDYTTLAGETGALMRAAGFGSGCAPPVTGGGRPGGDVGARAGPGRGAASGRGISAARLQRPGRDRDLQLRRARPAAPGGRRAGGAAPRRDARGPGRDTGGGVPGGGARGRRAVRQRRLGDRALR